MWRGPCGMDKEPGDVIRASHAVGSAQATRNPFTLLLQGLITPLARPSIAGLIAFLVYCLRASLNPRGIGATRYAYLNYLADAILHGQLSLRLIPAQTYDLVIH